MIVLCLVPHLESVFSSSHLPIRGKPEGHDVDILLSHPTEGAEVGLLPRLIDALGRRGLMLIGHKEKSSFRYFFIY